MKSLTIKKFFSLLLAFCIVFNTVLAVPFVVFATEELTSSADKDTAKKENEEAISHAYQPFASIKEYQYSENVDEVDESSLMLKVSANAPEMSPIPKEFADRGVTLVRTMVDVTTPEAMEELGVTTPYRWLMVGFETEKATEVALSFAEVSYVLDAEYNYVRQSSALPTEEQNPLMSNQWPLQDSSLQKSWQYIEDNNLRQNLEQVVVAVIDTGVDYTHPNLVNSMWVNVNEIPGNGIDDDNNGYADDVYGISALGNIFDANGDPMDEMGHGTHVAGIIAASAGSMGAVGVAYGSKIMAIKAGDSSGIFNDSDIIEGIDYAIRMGADVINMSFGSYARSAAIEDALALAYTSAVLVAAAGNDGVDIVYHGMPSYPAAYNFVIGVMATDMNGNVARFSNTDYILRRNSLEYEICAPGVSIFSTLPGNRYASWSGTSMACPYVSAVAALLRAKYNDKSVYSTRYIMGQIVGTAVGSDTAFPQVDPYAALTEIPEPDVSFYDYYIFDDPAYSEKNNGDGIIDAGETIGLGVLIRNHWGQARKTKVKLISAANSTDAAICPHVTWITDTIDYGDVGTFNSANNGFSYDADGVITGISNPFMFTVSENTPNDYHLPFALVIECESYTETDEVKTYRFDTDVFNIQVRKGYELPRLIDTDMTLTADRYYIISGSTLIESGVTVTVEPGTQIQFWGDYSKELYAGTDVAELLVDGELIIRGTATNPVDIFPSGGMSDMKIDIRTRLSTGRIILEYCNIANPVLDVTSVDHCYFTQMMFDCMCELRKDMDGRWYHSIVIPRVYADKISNSIFYELGYRYFNYDYRLQVGGDLVGNLFDSCGLSFDSWEISSYTDNVFLKNYRLVESQINDRTYLTSEFTIKTPYNGSNTMNPLYPVKNPDTGSTYFVLQTPSLVLAEDFAKRLGGSVVKIDNEAEQEFLLEYVRRYYSYNETLEDYTGWSSYLNHLHIGFYGNEDSVTYMGEGEAEDWLKIPLNTSIPVITTNYVKLQTGDVNREAWMSSFYSGNSDWMSALMSTNPSNNSYRDRGVIIEIPGEITPLSVSLECDALTIPSNTVDYRVLASVYPATDNYTLSWTSSDESIITIDAEGRMTAKALGTATITVTVDGLGLTASMIVVVTQYYAPESISDSVSEIVLKEYQKTQKLSPVIAPAEASALIEYTSSDSNVAMVGMDGTVTAISSGTATITARVVGTELTCTYTVKVIIPPSEIVLDENYVILSLDDESKLSLSYYFEPVYATEGSVEFVSSDESVVLVSPQGELTPVAPGNAVVWVSFPEIDRALQAKIIVVEDGSSMNIVKSTALANWEGASVLYAEDGTTYLLMNEEIFGNSKLVQEFPHKTKGVTCVYSDQWYYIDMENGLRGINASSQGEGTLIADGVSHLWSGRWNGNAFYYQKLDGTVWFYLNGTSIQNEWLETVVDAVCYSGNYIFLDGQGTLWFDKTPYSNDGPLTPLSFDAKPYVIDKKIVFMTNYGCFDEEGTFYRFNVSDDGFSMTKLEEFDVERMTQTLKVTWDQVVDVTRVEYGTAHWLLLLNDGRVIYAGCYYPGDTNMLADLISIPAYSGVGYCFLDLEDSFRDLGPGSLITQDGSVLTYLANYSAVLGNGKTYNQNQNLKRPVSPWIGMQDDGKDITFESATFTDENGAEATSPLELQAMMQGLVDPRSSITIALSKTAVSSSLGSITMKNGFGVKVELNALLDRFGNNLIITPLSALQEGYDYTISIPAGVIADEFNNTNRIFSFTFTAAGTAVYDVPVTGIEATGETAIVMEYGQSRALAINVLPENASMKKVYWKSSNERIATVNASGYVTAFFNGTATITATTADGGHVASFMVTVATQPETVSLSTGYFLLEVGETGQIEISSYPVYADLGALTFSSNRTDVVTVDENGVLTAVGLGSTLVGVTAQTTGETYYVLVDVVEDTASADIVEAIRSDYNSNSPVYFIAEDNSVWCISTNSYGGDNVYVPRKASFQAKDLYYDSNWNDLYYISLDNKLYLTDASMRHNRQELIAENVTQMAIRSHYIFYVTESGDTYFFDRNLSKTTKCSILTGIEDISYNDSHGIFLFLGQNGSLRYVLVNSLEAGISNGIFKTVENAGYEKITSVAGGYAFGENGGIYQIYNQNDEKLALSELTSLTQLAEYQAIKEQIVQILPAALYAQDNFIVRTADGNVWYLGSSSNIPTGLQNCIDLTGVSKTMIIRPITGVGNVVDMAVGYFVLDDGTVRAYQMDVHDYSSFYKIVIANNNVEQSSYRMPVVAWFGVNGEYSDIVNEGTKAVAGENSTQLSENEMIFGVLADSQIIVTFDRLLYSFDPTSIRLVDADENEIAVTITIKDNLLIITPNQSLRTGMIYKLNLFRNAVSDIFRNVTYSAEYQFVTEGELALPIPVTGITDTVTALTLQYGQTQLLTPTLLPENPTLPNVIWTTTDENVVTVDQTGSVTGRFNGTATVTVTTLDGSFSHSYEITVINLPETVSLTTGYFRLEVGESSKMEIFSEPFYADLGTLTFGSNRTDVVTVDENGVLTAVGLGSTLIYVASSVTGESYYALVDVVEDRSASNIVSIYKNDNNYAAAFIAEDNSVWYISADSNYSNENTYLPRKASFKAKQIYRDSGWSNLYYISLDNKLYRTDSSMQSNWHDLIAEDVAIVSVYGQHVFYVKLDGSTYYYDINTSKHSKCSLLTGTSEIYFNSYYGYFFFVNQTGAVRYAKASNLSDGLSNSNFKTLTLNEGETITGVMNRYAWSNNGTIYKLSTPEETLTLTEVTDITQNAEYLAIRDRIVALSVSSYSSSLQFIALLDDGSVYYVGSSYYLPVGLANCVDASDLFDNQSRIIVRPVSGIENVQALSIGYFICSDGTVRAYQVDTESTHRKLLANNNLTMRSYHMPVVSWFGAQGDYADILQEKAESFVGETTTPLSTDSLTLGLDVQSGFVITFNKQLFSTIDGITLIDMGGVVIPIAVTIADRSVIITPKEALKEGTLYTLSIPAGTVLDIFENSTEEMEFNFTTTGELHFEIPVQSITDTIGRLTLGYGDAQQLNPTITPTDASMKRVIWESSDTNVATVTQNGIVTGYQNGTATITVKTFDGEYKYEYVVTVYTPVESFTLSEEFLLLDLLQNKQAQLTGTVTPSYLAANGLFTWVVADPEIATVSADGTVTALKAGVTAVYCYCEGISEPSVCIVSVLSHNEDAFINSVLQKYGNGFLFEADDCIWLVDSEHMIPEKLVFQKAVEGGYEPIDVASMKQVLSIPYNAYSGDSKDVLILFLEENGTLMLYSSKQPNQPLWTREGVQKAAFYNDYLFLLLGDGTLVQCHYGWNWDHITQDNTIFYLDEARVEAIEGIRDMVYQDNGGALFLLQINKGLVWSYNPHYGENALQLVFGEEPITDITLGNGDFMRGESGKIYPMCRDSSNYQSRLDWLNNNGFYNLDVEIADLTVQDTGNYELLIQTTDGKLLFLGHYKTSNPLEEQYSGYIWTQSMVNNNLYYIEVDKAIADIGSNWILFADGMLKMFGRYEYLGNAKYTEYNEGDSLCSPYFTETEIDLHSLTMQKVTVGDTVIEIGDTPTSVDSSNTITLEYSLPLVPTDQLLATTVKDSQNNFPAFDIRVEGRKVILIFNEPLRAGETYTVKLFQNAAQDIFHNRGEMISFTFQVKDAESSVQFYQDSLYPTTEYSPDWTLKQLQTEAREYYDEVLYAYIEEHSTNVGNAFLNAFANPDTTAWMRLTASSSINTIGSLIGNFWGTSKTDLIDRIIYDVNDSFNYGEILYGPILSQASETAYPFVTSIIVKNAEGTIVSSVGMEEITVEVYFNRDMDVTVEPFVSYGSEYPFGDFAVTGTWRDARTWVGTTKISAVTGSGTQYFKVRGAVAAGDSWLVTGNDYERFAFTIATSGAKSMSMQANGGDGYVSLEWEQDDYETMAGYNVYRCEQLEGTYTKLNSTLLSQDITSYVDSNVAPGVQYYYYFTVVGTDLKESEPSGIAMAAAQDTTAPEIKHTAVVQAPQGAAISIVAEVRDNIRVAFVKLYYRVKGQTEYASVEMYCNSDASHKYTATIPAGVVTEAGVEYYIEANDGRQSGTRYSAVSPQSVSTYRMYLITVMTVSGGRITVSKTRAKAGDYVTVSAIADGGYAYLADTLKYTYGQETYHVNGSGFTMPASDIVITASFVTESIYAYGDLNRDGAVNSADAILLLRYDAGLEMLDDEQILLADVNRDGRVTVYDAREILRIDAGL